jgi:hypothetical protein
MSYDLVTLRRGPDRQHTYPLVESSDRFVVHSNTSLPGGSAARASQGGILDGQHDSTMD